MNRRTQERARDHLRSALAYAEPRWDEIMLHVKEAYELLCSDERHMHQAPPTPYHPDECGLCGRDIRDEIHTR